ncbi:Gfo/Idh/MocA family oxidoreductase [Falsarthrobacter nasiphocae]|uniref:Dehydrogenase n=1 Tax=Falsarthrobacter nasiphocae TaxID=189863 RepID=A0AAE3YEF0_9MICC|nr:Gfo/Idh/MocA family oxidoreductase [Falsarthrobacter nasiphocae]MDR6891690.1 putative dehydrogenase [Falsarthrobacter nasiphocae]
MTSLPAPIPAPLLPLDADPRTATGRTLGWGIVSTGRIAEKVTPDIALLEDARLVAVSSRSQEAAEDFARRLGVERAYGDETTTAAAGRVPATGLERMLADPEVDVVYVATPHGQHAEHARAALEAGKHVVCEKAVTINAAELRGLLDLARAKGLFFMEGLWTRFQPGVQRIMALVADGVVGTPEWIQSSLGFVAPADPDHRIWRVDAGGGALLDLGVYVLHWPWAVFGFPTQVDATARRTASGVDELTGLTGVFEGGHMAQMQMSLVSDCPSTAVISGSGGTLVVEKPLHAPRTARIVRTPAGARLTGQDAPAEEVLTFELEGKGYVYEMREATTRIQLGDTESPVMSWADSLRQMELFDSIRESIGVVYPNDEA